MENKDFLNIKFKIHSTNPDEGLDCLTFILHYFSRKLGKIIQLDLPEYDEAWYKNPEKWDLYSDNLHNYCKTKRFIGINYLKEYNILFFYFNEKDRVSHAGIYIGNGEFIHCVEGNGVIITKLSDVYIRKIAYVGEIK